MEIRKNADVFLNLLTLMVVCDLDELDMAAIDWMKGALFLDVTKEEASVLFKKQIEDAKACEPGKSWRPTDNVIHIWSDQMKDRKLKKAGIKADEKREAEEKRRAEEERARNGETGE